MAADICFAADATELMDAGVSADVGAIFDDHVARKRRSIGHDHVVAEKAIMSDVHLSHHETIVAGFGQAASARGTAMNRNKLPDAVAPADFRFGSFACELQILRRQTYRDEWKDMRFVSDARTAVDYAMTVNAHSIT